MRLGARELATKRKSRGRPVTLPELRRLPDELERRQIFHTLQRWSSYTAWKRILDYFQAWADAIEDSLREASAQGLEQKTSLPESDYVAILKDLAICDEGVRQLLAGDKRVFRRDGSLNRAFDRTVAHWSRLLNYIAIGEIGIDYANTPGWPRFEHSLRAMLDALRECGPDIREPKEENGGESRTFFNEILKAELEASIFPDPLPEIPSPPEESLVQTGRHVPFSGIWEPVDAPSRTLMSLFKNPPPPPGPYPIVGTMTYLHGGSHAPAMASYGKIDGEPTTWRLLWRDDRYTDGTVPEEERQYHFLAPKPSASEPAADVPAEPSMMVLESGQRTPVSGHWLLQDKLGVAVDLGLGEVLPEHQGAPARWVLADRSAQNRS
jgi:hypothetical protein